MGINICISRAKVVNSGRYEKYPEDVSKEFNWDSLRYGGDRELINFIVQSGYDEISNDNQDYLFKPKNYQTVRDFINTMVVECNRPRLLKLMDILENNEDIFIDVSW